MYIWSQARVLSLFFISLLSMLATYNLKTKVFSQNYIDNIFMFIKYKTETSTEQSAYLENGSVLLKPSERQD